MEPNFVHISGTFNFFRISDCNVHNINEELVFQSSKPFKATLSMEFDKVQ